MSTVSVQRTAGYAPEALYQSVCAHFEALQLSDILTPETKVLLKPNLLGGRDPALAVTTHPALLYAIAKRLREMGVTKIVLADSPGGLYTPATLRKVYGACHLNSLSEVLTLNEDVSVAERNGFPIIQPVWDADFIINCPKLKTHGLTVMTAGVKNLFGCIPGLKKPEMHCVKPATEDFCAMLLDLCETVKPHLTLLDAVDCMEGNGPSGGKVRAMGYTLCSRDVYALDEAAAALMGLNPNLAPLLRQARQRGLCNPAEITCLGDALSPASPPFRLPDSIIAKDRLFSARGVFNRLFGRKRSYPKMVPAKCVGCGRCAESCPKLLIDLVQNKAVIARKGCISCFCCQEMCPAHAIETIHKRG